MPYLKWRQLVAGVVITGYYLPSYDGWTCDDNGQRVIIRNPGYGYFLNPDCDAPYANADAAAFAYIQNHLIREN